jgi:DHA2 family multidrug resistance protein-like MFS transporter
MEGPLAVTTPVTTNPTSPAAPHARATRGPARGAAGRWFALAVLMLPVLLVSIDNTVLSFALPQISESLRPSG